MRFRVRRFRESALPVRAPLIFLRKDRVTAGEKSRSKRCHPCFQYIIAMPACKQRRNPKKQALMFKIIVLFPALCYDSG